MGFSSLLDFFGQGQDCFICKRGGHRAKDCPEKHKGGSSSSKICLKCGESGHDMFMCSSDYSPDDLKVRLFLQKLISFLVFYSFCFHLPEVCFISI